MQKNLTSLAVKLENIPKFVEEIRNTRKIIGPNRPLAE
jgi:hypothetical protein